VCAEIIAETKARLTAVRPKQPCQCHDGLTIATLAKCTWSSPRLPTRPAIMGLPVNTRADALAALAVLEDGEDRELCTRLSAKLRGYLSVPA
jgi:hypothetical protein